MTPTRLKRLLLLAKYGGDHKRFYKDYCKIIGKYAGWAIGMAYILPEGERMLEKLIHDTKE